MARVMSSLVINSTQPFLGPPHAARDRCRQGEAQQNQLQSGGEDHQAGAPDRAGRKEVLERPDGGGQDVEPEDIDRCQVREGED